MSKINAVRLININYNNNTIRVSDETFHFNGQSTLMSLRNGGGKSVLVQMMTAPFVHKRYRDAKDRPFENYFTTNKPSFIMTEWVLEKGAGYVLTVNIQVPVFMIFIIFQCWKKENGKLY